MIVRIRPRQRKGQIREAAAFAVRVRRQGQDLLHLERAEIRFIRVGEDNVRRLIVGHLHLIDMVVAGFRGVRIVGLSTCAIARAGFSGSAGVCVIDEVEYLLHDVNIPSAVFIVERELFLLLVFIRPVLIALLRSLSLADGGCPEIFDFEVEDAASIDPQLFPIVGFDCQRGDRIAGQLGCVVRGCVRCLALVVPIHIEGHCRQRGTVCVEVAVQSFPQLLSCDGVSIGQRVDEGAVLKQSVLGIGVAALTVELADVARLRTVIRPSIVVAAQVQRILSETRVLGFIPRRRRAVAGTDDSTVNTVLTGRILHRLIVIVAGMDDSALDGVVLDLVAVIVVLPHVVQRHAPLVVSIGDFNLYLFVYIV